MGTVTKLTERRTAAALESARPPDAIAHADGLGASGWLWCAGVAAAGTIMVGFRWVNFTISRDLYGFAFSLFGYSQNHSQVELASFGGAAALILGCAIAAKFLGRASLQAWLGALLLLLVFLAYLEVAAGDANLLLVLARQSDWWVMINGRIQTLGQKEPGIWPQLSFDTLIGRLVSGWYYLGLGWYAAVGAGLLTLANALMTPGKGAKRAGLVLAATIISSIVLAAAFLTNPIRAQQAFVAAMNSEMKGDIQTARSQYRRAIDLDPWYARNPKLYDRIGALDGELGRTDSPEYALYEAEQLFDQNQSDGSIWEMEAALDKCDRVARTAGLVGSAARMRCIDARLAYGKHLFADGSVGSAAKVWRAALSQEPGNWLAAYYLTLADPAVYDYYDLARLSERFIADCGDPATIGIFYDSLGKAQIELGDSEAGHAAYYASYQIDYLNNHDAIGGLIGP